MELLKQSVGDIIDLQYVENLLEKVSEKQRPGSPTDRPTELLSAIGTEISD